MLNALRAFWPFSPMLLKHVNFVGSCWPKKYIFGEYLTMLPAVKPNRHSGNAIAVLYGKVLPQSIKLRL